MTKALVEVLLWTVASLFRRRFLTLVRSFGQEWRSFSQAFTNRSIHLLAILPDFSRLGRLFAVYNMLKTYRVPFWVVRASFKFVEYTL